MGRRRLVILAVLGLLVGSAGLAQARGGHGRHGHYGGLIMGSMGMRFPGLGSTWACGSPPSGLTGVGIDDASLVRPPDGQSGTGAAAMLARILG
jgi:hypothetical protein